MNRTVALVIDAGALPYFEGCSSDESGFGALLENICMKALAASDYKPTNVVLPIECVEFGRKWLESSLAECEKLLDEHGLRSQVDSERQIYTRPRHWLEEEDPSIVHEYLDLQDLLGHTREALGEVVGANCTESAQQSEAVCSRAESTAGCEQGEVAKPVTMHAEHAEGSPGLAA